MIFGIRKLRVPGLSCSFVCVILCLAVLIQYWSVTDTQTDIHTNDDGIYHAGIASRGNKRYCFYTVSHKTTLTLHTVTSTHINRFG